MIWFLRILFLFSIGLAAAIYSHDEISIAQSTISDKKFEPAMKLVLQSYTNQPIRFPGIGETITSKLRGEEIKITVIEFLPDQKLSLELTGFSHYESLKETYQFQERENSVQINSNFILRPKADPLSRLLFLFFGSSTLQDYAKKIHSSLVIPEKIQ